MFHFLTGTFSHLTYTIMFPFGQVKIKINSNKQSFSLDFSPITNPPAPSDSTGTQVCVWSCKVPESHEWLSLTERRCSHQSQTCLLPDQMWGTSNEEEKYVMSIHRSFTEESQPPRGQISLLSCFRVPLRLVLISVMIFFFLAWKLLWPCSSAEVLPGHSGI